MGAFTLNSRCSSVLVILVIRCCQLALLPSGAPVPVMSDSTQDRINVSHSERDFSVANNLKLDLSSWTDAGHSQQGEQQAEGQPRRHCMRGDGVASALISCEYKHVFTLK